MSIFESFGELMKEKFKFDSHTMSEREFFAAEIASWRGCEKRRLMIDGEKYFRGEHDILKRERKAISSNGELKKVDNLPNNRIVDNQYQRLVRQKVNYMLGRRFVIDAENDGYKAELEKLFNHKFQRALKGILRDAINYGIAWLYVYVNDVGELCFRRIPSYEILPFWSDEEHTVLDRAVRVYKTEGYIGNRPYESEKVEIYSRDGVKSYELRGGELIDEQEYSLGDVFQKIPLVAFKYNEREIPLISRVKSLQDSLNLTLSDLQNNLQENVRNSILVLQNYDGTDLGEFRHNLSLYGAVKVKTVDGAPGDIKTLSTQFSGDNYSLMVQMLKNAIVENAMGYNSDSDKIGNSPNQLVIRSMYSDLDLDIGEAETEFKSSMQEVKEIIDSYLLYSGRGYFSADNFEIIFNKDCLVNESEAIDNCVKSRGMLSDKTVILQHPWVDDVTSELGRIKEEE